MKERKIRKVWSPILMLRGIKAYKKADAEKGYTFIAIPSYLRRVVKKEGRLKAKGDTLKKAVSDLETEEHLVALTRQYAESASHRRHF